MEGKGGYGRGGKERRYTPPVVNSWLRHWRVKYMFGIGVVSERLSVVAVDHSKTCHVVY